MIFPGYRMGYVIFPARGVGVGVEMATLPVQRDRGLMFRTHLAENHGMLFFFPHRGVHKVWMKNVPIALDAIFIDGGVVTAIISNMRPHDTTIRTPGALATLMLEVNGDWCNRYGVRVGDKVDIGP